MAFVNEYLSKEDVEKYQVKELDEKFNKGHRKPDWTIDRKRKIFLRYLHNEREEYSNRKKYYFSWKDNSIIVTIDLGLSQRNDENEWRYKLVNLEISPSLEVNLQEILDDLKEAITVHRIYGIRSDDELVFNVDFDF